MKLEHGTVKFVKKDRNYGFISVPGRDDVYFRVSDGIRFVLGTSAYPEQDRSHESIPQPRKGDKVVFIRETGRRGDEANPWGYDLNYAEVMEKIQDRAQAYPIGLYVSGSLNYLEYQMVEKPGAMPGEQKISVSPGQISRLPVVQGGELLETEVNERISRNRKMLKCYDAFLAKPPKVELDEHGDGYIHYRRFSLKVESGYITSEEPSQATPDPVGLVTSVWYEQMGGVAMDDLADDPAVIVMLQQNVVNPHVSFGDRCLETTLNKLACERRLVLYRLVNSLLLRKYLADPGEFVSQMSQVRDQLVRELKKVGRVTVKDRSSQELLVQYDEQGSHLVSVFGQSYMYWQSSLSDRFDDEYVALHVPVSITGRS